MDQKHLMRVRNGVRFFYDLQKLRIQAGNRNAKQAELAALEESDREFMDDMSKKLNAIEKDGLKEIKRLLKGMPIWEQWLKHQKGVAETMGGLIVAEIFIEHCNTASQLWAWCGLAVRNGQADRRVKGQKTKFNPWLKSKMVAVLGGCLLKANSPWREFYDNYKHRKTNQRVDVCMQCEGKGVTVVTSDYDEEPMGKVKPKKPKKPKKCWNCEGTGGPAPWGKSDKHRHQAAMRYMVKMFLLELWKTWRDLEGLPVRVPYAEEYLGRKHHGEPLSMGQPRDGGESRMDSLSP